MSFKNTTEVVLLERIKELRLNGDNLETERYAPDTLPMVKELYRQQSNSVTDTYHELENLYCKLYDKPDWNYHRNWKETMKEIEERELLKD